MITNSGKELIGKFLLGQAPSYATHISIGCGAVPLDQNDTPPSASEIQAKNVMDFEMLRVPISSKGFVDDAGTTKLSFSSELPTENRYGITEVALWSAGSNNLASNSDSKMIFNFSEPWQIHNESISEIPYLDNIGANGDISITNEIFSASSNNIILTNAFRSLRKEGARYLNSKIFMRGDTSEITGLSGSWEATSSSTHIHFNNATLPIGSNSPSDKLKLALSLINRTAAGSEGVPDTVKILIEFYRNEVTVTRGFAKAEIELDGSVFSGNSYHVEEIPISSLITSNDFTAADIRVCRIFVSIIKDSVLSQDHFIALDGFRIDNISTENPLYKMVGYSIVDISGNPIVKYPNTNNYIDFRMSLGIV